MYFNDLIDKYGKGASNEKMKDLTNIISEFLAPMKKVHKEKYWSFMRDVFGLLNDNHYDSEFAEHDVKNIEYIDIQGVKHKGGYWTFEQAEEAMKKVQLPQDANKYDWYVALNNTYADTCKVLDDEQIIKLACQFWFKEQDWAGKDTSSTKIFEYMKCKYGK